MSACTRRRQQVLEYPIVVRARLCCVLLFASQPDLEDVLAYKGLFFLREDGLTNCIHLNPPRMERRSVLCL
jgi:hypothetical protein